MKETVKLTMPNGAEFNFDIKRASLGQDVIDISKLYQQTGMFTLDPGFMSTASCQSKITFIDGDEGELLYRGYSISDLADGSYDFMEISYLLLYGELPSKQEFKDFQAKINKHTLVHDQLENVLCGFTRTAHPMSMIIGLLGSMSAFYHDKDFTQPEVTDLVCLRAISKICTIIGMVYKRYIGQAIMSPLNKLDYSSNFLRMMFGVTSEDYEVSKIFRDAMNIIFILHADHEQNASTSTVRLSGSSGANPFACLAAGTASLWGPSHGGANEAVISMLEEIEDIKNISGFIQKVKNKSDGVKLMGFGHRVYKNFDPRANILREQSKKVLSFCGNNNKLMDIALELERIALSDDYFKERKLYPNVDFYSGIILQAIGIPTIMFTPIFALSRVSGWIAQWKEMIETENKIGRPRQLYIGEKRRFVTK
jgi:citrate synthase